MNLDYINDIITDNLAVQIDLTNQNSWNLNTGLTVNSLSKWTKATSDNINLIDFGLTEFDVGRNNKMWNGITITPNDTLFSMHRIGYNIVNNPTTGETSGVTITTQYLPMTGITSDNTGNYFDLKGGYLQGFFKLDGYNYELLPSRFNDGITIETLLYLYPDSEGIFYMMGARAEDKYNPYFSGETTINNNTANGVITSKDHHLESIKEKDVIKDAFNNYEDRFKTELEKTPQSANTSNNVIAFEITNDKKIAYKYINSNNQIIYNKSNKSINPPTGWTTISISFIPNGLIEDSDLLDCYKQRNGKFIIFINGRPLWILNDYPEFFFKAFNNDPEKQIGVPYSISWGGGSFGLKHSWHYDVQTYGLYINQNQKYIDNNFIIEDQAYDDGINIMGLSLSADSKTFKNVKDDNLEYPATVMRVEHTGNTSAQTYFIKYNNPIIALSNREYIVDLSLFVNGFFKSVDDNNFFVNNSVSLIVYGTEDIDIIEEDKYKYPVTTKELQELNGIEKRPFPDEQEYQYVFEGVSYYGVTGLPVYDDPDYYTFYGVNPATQLPTKNGIYTGQEKWIPLKLKFKIKDNSGKQKLYMGLLIETSDSFNLNKPLYISDYTYTGADILSQDPRKNELLIQQNFNSSFNGRIQKLRIYDRGLTSSEILHNTIIESKKNPNLNIAINKGGRIIYK